MQQESHLGVALHYATGHHLVHWPDPRFPGITNLPLFYATSLISNAIEFGREAPSITLSAGINMSRS